MKQSKTAILIFANSAEKEAVLKPFQFSKDVFEALNVQSLNIVKKTGLPYFIFSEAEQIGNSFGERFTNAIESVYSNGFDKVITIGNDTPHLTLNHIKKTVEKLNSNSVVLGPATDGGFYLMGLKKSHFNAETFLKLPWQTASLRRSISKLQASKNIAICYLEVLSDIDSVSDIKQIFNSFKSISIVLKQLLIKLISTDKRVLSSTHLYVENFILNQQFNKGSPLPLHL